MSGVDQACIPLGYGNCYRVRSEPVIELLVAQHAITCWYKNFPSLVEIKWEFLLSIKSGWIK